MAADSEAVAIFQMAVAIEPYRAAGCRLQKAEGDVAQRGGGLYGRCDGGSLGRRDGKPKERRKGLAGLSGSSCHAGKQLREVLGSLSVF